MEATLKRIRENVINECHLNGIAEEHIQFGYEYAEHLFEQNKNIAYSVVAGIEIAKGQQKRLNNHRRSVLNDGAFF